MKIVYCAKKDSEICIFSFLFIVYGTAVLFQVPAETELWADEPFTYFKRDKKKKKDPAETWLAGVLLLVRGDVSEVADALCDIIKI